MIEVGAMYMIWSKLWIVTGPMMTDTGKPAWIMSPLHDMSEWMWDYESDILHSYQRVA